MGRRRDRPDVQAAKGYPGRRKSKVEREQERVEELARLMGAAPADGSAPYAPPAFLDQRFAPALAIWREYVPQLAKLNLFQALDRHTFALFCVYYGEWVLANEDILANGYSKMVKTVSGDLMPRENPSVGRRDIALKAVMKLAEKFGLTQLDRYALIGQQAARLPTGLFEQPGKPAEQAPAEQGAIGALRGADSLPPGTKPN